MGEASHCWRLPCQGRDLYLRCFQGKGKRALGSSGLSQQLLKEWSRDLGVLRDPSTPQQQRKCQPRDPFCPSPSCPPSCDQLPLGHPKSQQLLEPGLQEQHKPKSSTSLTQPQDLPSWAEDIQARAPGAAWLLAAASCPCMAWGLRPC